MKNKGKSKSKLSDKQKKKRAQIEAKYKEHVVDYFPRDSEENDGLIFNKAPVIKENIPAKKKSKEKKKALKEESRNKSTFEDDDLFQDYDSDEEMEGPKKLKSNAYDALFDDFRDGLLGANQSFVDYFANNQSSFRSLTKMGNFRYTQGSLVLAAVCDKGPTDKYLVVNLSRNKRGYVSFSDIGEGTKNHIKHFEKGEYVLGVALASTDKKVQLSLKPSFINKNIGFHDIQVNQILVGYLKEKEDYGYMIDFCTEDNVTGFLYFPEVEGTKFYMGRPYMFKVTKKNEATNMVDCQIIHPSLMFDNEPLNGKEIKKQQESGEINLETLAAAGNLINGTVKKVLENGLLVSFLQVFYGFIFQDHLPKPLSEYKNGEKIIARIIATDWESKAIHLSALDHHINLSLYSSDIALGTGFKNVTVSEVLYGGSYWLKTQEDDEIGSLKLFLHKTHVGSNQKFEVGNTIETVFVKDHNYFEHFPVVTMRDDVLATLKVFWSNLQPGEIVNGTVAKVVDSDKELKLIINLNKFVNGVVNYMHISENPTKASLAKLREKKEIKARVLSVDVEKKQLQLTMKPSLLDPNINILKDYQTAEQGKPYIGVITNAVDQGYLVKFFNNVVGFLPYSDIENAGMKREDYIVGQSVRVYIRFIDQAKERIGLTLSSKAAEQTNKQVKPWNNVENQNTNHIDITESGINLGDVYQYKVLRKKSATNEEYLIVKSVKGVKAENYVDHVAILPKSHLSDFEGHNERLFNLYKITQNITFEAKVLSFLPNNNILITKKSTLVRNELPQSLEEVNEKHQYYGFIDSIIHSGMRVSLSGTVTGVLSTTKLPEEIQANFASHFHLNQTVRVFVSKVKSDEGKLYFELPDDKEKQELKEEELFQEFFNEEFLLAKEKIQNSPQVWETYKIGNYVKVKIDMIKEYGIIVKLKERLAGLLIRSNLLNDYEDYKVGQTLICRILDVDYEKSIIDLCEENVSEEKFESKYKDALDYNKNKILKYKLYKLKKDVIGATILLVKDTYLVAKLNKYPKVIAIVQCKKFNDTFESHQQFNKHSAIKFKPVNATFFDPENMNIEGVEKLKKSNSVLLGAIYTGVKAEGTQESTDTVQNDAWLKKNLKVGLFVTGRVTKISGNNIFVALTKTIFGRIHKTQFDFDPRTGTSAFDNYQVGNEIKAKVLSVRKTDHLHVELTALSSQLSLPEEELDPNFLLNELTEEHKFKKYTAVIKSISVKSLNPIYLELSNTLVGYANAFDGIISPNDTDVYDKIEKLNNLGNHYQVGQVVQVWIKDIKKETTDIRENISAEVSFYDPNLFKKEQKKSQIAIVDEEEEKGSFRVGQLLVCRVSKILKKGIRVQYARDSFGYVDITELFDEFYAYPLKKAEERLNTFVLGRIIAFSVSEDENEKGNEIFISLRQSILNNDNWKVIAAEGTTLQFKKKLGKQEEYGDLRSRIYKLGLTSIKPNMIFVGYVSQTNDKGCFIKLSFNVTARASHKELSDVHLLNPSATFFENRLVIGRILSIREDGKIDVTLRENAVKYGYVLEESKIRPGLILKGVVSGFSKSAAIVSLFGCKYTANLKPEDVNTEGKSIEKALPVGTPLLTKIKSIEKNANPMRIRVTCRITEEELNDESNRFEFNTAAAENIVRLYESIQKTCEEYETTGVKDVINPKLIENSKKQIEEEEEEKRAAEGIEEEEQDDDNNGIDVEEEGNGEMNGQNENQMYDEEEEEEEEPLEDIKEEQSVISEEEDVEDLDLLLSNKSAGKKKKEIEKMKLEAEIREREKKLLDDNEKELKTSDDYEKLLLKNPNSSYIWIQYIAFKFEKEGIEKARQLMERALRHITFRSEDEKLNLWTAYLNLEYNFGKEDTLLKVFERAKAANNPKKVYLKMIDLYKRDGKWEHVEELSKAMIKKHKNSAKAWIAHMDNTFEILKSRGTENVDLSEIVARALQSLHKRKHLKVLTHHGILLFRKGQQEKGRTVFEAIVTNYPKRTDIWNVYIDMEIKYGTKESARNILERTITLNLNPKKMKFFFKRYLKYEMEHGDAARVEYVKNMANTYVESLINKGE